MLVSFRALLRKGHVKKSHSTLVRLDFVFYEWGMIVRISKSKTTQYRERTHLIPVSKVADPALCGVYSVKRHFKETEAEDHMHAFRIPKRLGSISMP